MSTILALADFEVLGIPAPRWPEVMADSRILAFDEWSALHVGPRPACASVSLWEHVARRVYTEGPLTYFMATHVN